MDHGTQIEAEPIASPFDGESCRLPYSFCKRYGVFTVLDEKGLIRANHLPNISIDAIAEVQRFCARPVVFAELEEKLFEEQLRELYEGNSSDAFQITTLLSMEEVDLQSTAQDVAQLQDVLEQDNDAPVIRLINAILIDSVKQRASDIHIETTEKYLQVRFRIDGILHKILEVKRSLAPILVSRIKVMSDLDIAEKRIPQDGRMSFRFGNKTVDIRVSLIPSADGERVVMRLLDKSGGLISLNKVGLLQDDLDAIDNMIAEPFGIILVVGPTGAGKTTTLYATLNELNEGSRNIMTVEDPVEYNLDNISQTQVNTKIGMTFAAGLRAILRQDPDVVMLGEIRDEETANIAVQASLTGHLVLSTLHTNTAAAAITRLRDIGIAPYLISSSLVGVIAQRLVRKLCPDCKEIYSATPEECRFMREDPMSPPSVYRAVGCDSCNGLGYKGRLGIYEVLPNDDTVRKMIHDEKSDSDIADYSHVHRNSLFDDAIQKIMLGQTTVSEAMRVVGG